MKSECQNDRQPIKEVRNDDGPQNPFTDALQCAVSNANEERHRHWDTRAAISAEGDTPSRSRFPEGPCRRRFARSDERGSSATTPLLSIPIGAHRSRLGL